MEATYNFYVSLLFSFLHLDEKLFHPMIEYAGRINAIIYSAPYHKPEYLKFPYGTQANYSLAFFILIYWGIAYFAYFEMLKFIESKVKRMFIFFEKNKQTS